MTAVSIGNSNIAPYSTFKESNCSISYMIARILKAILPKTWFCWISRGTIQLQSTIRPKKWSYWSKLSDRIFLGAMPLKNWNHSDTITKLGVKAILSINEDYELKSQLFADPITSKDWQEKNINFLNISSPDLEPIEPVKLAKAVNYVAEQHHLGNPVYIHCTGGRGRSVSVAICSLIKLERFTFDSACSYLKQCRPQVMLNRAQIDSIKSWHRGQYQTV